MNSPDDLSLVAEDLGRVHLVGIGGVGMSAVARLLLTRGISVSGSELHEWPTLTSLGELGATIFRSHNPRNLDAVDTVVYSSAIPDDHVELAEARARGLRLLHRAQALAITMNGQQAIAVAGTHGKTTTTSMVTLILRHAGLDPSYVIGGEISELGSNAQYGRGEHLVAEADEGDRSFLLYRPHVAVVTNIDADHLNTYGNLGALRDAFVDFCGRVVPGGFVVACADDPGTREMAGRARAAGVTVYTYGQAADADLRVENLATMDDGVRYHAILDGHSLGEIVLSSPGLHLGLNSAGAVLVALRLGVKPETAVEALAHYPGVRRRFERKGIAAGVRVYDEYAYHPTSMSLALKTLRKVAGDGRLLVVFQPYRVYRTRALESDLAESLAIADEVILMEVFGPGETLEPGQGGQALLRAIGLPGERKVFVPGWEDVASEVVNRARPGDIVVTMGAPPISLMGDELLSALATTRPGHSAAGEEAAPSPHYVARHARPETAANG